MKNENPEKNEKFNKVVYNNCFGGFGLSDEAMRMLKEMMGFNKDEYFTYYDIPRHDLDLIKVVETLGTKNASGVHGELTIAKVGPEYIIDEYDGSETVVEPEDMEWIVVDNKKTKEIFPELFL